MRHHQNGVSTNPAPILPYLSSPDNKHDSAAEDVETAGSLVSTCTMSCLRTATSTDVNDDADFTTLVNPLRLVLRETPTAGRGVFATQDIPVVGTVVERSPVLVLSKEEWERGRLEEGVLGGYAFSWSQGGMAIGLGIGK